MLGNSAAIWLLLPFGSGTMAARPVRGAIAGGVALLTTVLAEALFGVLVVLGIAGWHLLALMFHLG